MFEIKIIGFSSYCLGHSNLHQVFPGIRKDQYSSSDDRHHIREGPFPFCFSLNDCKCPKKIDSLELKKNL